MAFVDREYQPPYRCLAGEPPIPGPRSNETSFHRSLIEIIQEYEQSPVMGFKCLEKHASLLGKSLLDIMTSCLKFMVLDENWSNSETFWVMVNETRRASLTMEEDDRALVEQRLEKIIQLYKQDSFRRKLVVAFQKVVAGV